MNSEFVLRPAQSSDTTAIFELIQALAEYEKLSHAVTGSVEALQDHLFGSHPYVEAIVAECEGKAVGFALYFYNYSTFLTKPGIYLEDLFVLPEYRRQGIGKAIFKYLAQLAVERDCGRLEWSVLDWNEPTIAFYRQIGAKILEDWRICRLTSTALTQLANDSPFRQDL
jgi:GNAT superfamily N-acetyltransferase